MRIHLNLATKPLELHRRFLAATNLSIFVGAMLFIVLGWHVYSARQAAAAVRERTAKLDKEYAECDRQRRELEAYFSQKDIASLKDRAVFINNIIAVRSFNWTKMFMDLEHVLPGGVRVISIEPKQVGGHVEVKLTAGAVSDEVMLNFVHALETSKEFKDVEVQGIHTGPQQGGDQRVVQLTTFYAGT